jgi:hypothetical protein
MILSSPAGLAARRSRVAVKRCSALSQPIDAELPLKQYFLGVGGALLALLFAADALMPRTVSENIAPGPALPKIRIYSERKGPEAVVIDTKQLALAPVTAEQAELPMSRQTFALPNARVRQSFAQLVASSKISAGENDSKNEMQRLKVTKTRQKHQPVPIAQRQNFGFLDSRW